MQPEILIFRSPMSCCRAELGEVVGDALRHRDRARIGQRAIVEARAGDDVGDLADIGLGEAQPAERAPDRRQVLDRDMRQDQVLLVADPDLALAVGVGDVGDAFHLHGAGIARRRAGGLQRDGDDGDSPPGDAARRWTSATARSRGLRASAPRPRRPRPADAAAPAARTGGRSPRWSRPAASARRP